MSRSRQDIIGDSIRLHAMLGLALVVAVVFGLGGWAYVTEIAGAVIASGQVVVESDVKKVQHPTGGVVRDLKVREGDSVKVGDLLIRLDDTLTRANLAIVVKALDEMQARKARLVAERDSRDRIDVPPLLAARGGHPEVERILDGEKKLFTLRRTARNGQMEQLRQRIEQYRQKEIGAKKQAEAKVKEFRLIQRELEGARRLWQKNLMPISKLTALEREATRIDGERGALLASIAEAKGKIAETELQIFQIDRDFGSEVAKEMAEVDARIGELVERKVAAEDQLKRIDLRAPQDGRVHQLAVHTEGGVISAGETLMLIVPDADQLSVEAQVMPHDIDQLRVEQEARLRFTAFNQTTTQDISGKVALISANTTTDQRSGMSYYSARIDITDNEMVRLNGLKLVPGMPVEVFFETGQRSVISYLVKPLRDQMARALRER